MYCTPLSQPPLPALKPIGSLELLARALLQQLQGLRTMDRAPMHRRQSWPSVPATFRASRERLPPLARSEAAALARSEPGGSPAAYGCSCRPVRGCCLHSVARSSHSGTASAAAAVAALPRSPDRAAYVLSLLAAVAFFGRVA